MQSDMDIKANKKFFGGEYYANLYELASDAHTALDSIIDENSLQTEEQMISRVLWYAQQAHINTARILTYLTNKAQELGHVSDMITFTTKEKSDAK